MSTSYLIAEVADRSGFTPATLRYYEDIGLVAPAGRSEAGYRLYDDASLDRLRFIARAKRLGCTLDEIAELVTAWDGGQCAHVLEQLRATVAAKIGESQRRIAEMTALTADLQRAAATLAAAEAVPGPCDESCGCLGAGPATGATAVPGATAVQLVSKPDTSIACTLDAESMGSRSEAWASLLAAGAVARHRVEDGVRVELGPAADLAEIARLAAAEHDCCRFFRFALTIDDRGAALEVRAPTEAADLVAAMFGAAA
jgi:MerR family transcriptional regulator, copper efflux regulator